MSVSAARLCAYKILTHDKFNHVPVKDLIDGTFDERDARFAEKLVNGVQAYKPCLDLAIKKSCTPNTKIAKKIMIALEISAYELLYLKKEPYIAVNEGVELVKHANRHASGLANVVLKNVASLDLSNFSEFLKCGFSEEVFQILINELGENEALSFIEMSDIPPNSAKIGNIYADNSSVEIAKSISDVLANANSFLEVGAGRGTKTCLIQHFLDKEKLKHLEYDILEVNADKLNDLRARTRENHLIIDNYICEDATKFLSSREYDVVFVDAPCSGLGTIRKHREIRWRTSRSDIENLHNLNVAILKNLSAYVNKDALLIYSTCTITHDENMGVIDEFLTSDMGYKYKLENVIREPILTESSDAHFCVTLRRK